MRRKSARLPDEIADAIERAARHGKVSENLVIATALAYWFGHIAGFGDALDLQRRVKRLEDRVFQRRR
jgi:hypothetical protein